MLSFMTFPRSFFNGPLVRAERANLRRHTATQGIWIRWISRFFVVIALATGSIPFWLDMRDTPRSMLLFPLIILAVYIVHLNVALKTLTLASHSVAREALAENWDSLVMTGIDARKIVQAKWLAVMSSVWRDYLWLAFLKIGLAIGLAKYFDDVFYGSCYRHLAGGLCYVTGYYPYYRYVINDRVLPFLLYVTVICLLSLAEAGLLTALGIGFGSLNRQHRIIGLGCAAVCRGLLIALAIVVWVVIGDHSRRLYNQTAYYSPLPNPAIYRWNMNVVERQEILGSVQFVLSPLADNGTVLITDMLRPAQSLEHMIVLLITTTGSFACFGGLIWLSLRLAEMLAVRQRALRPRERELRTSELAV